MSSSAEAGAALGALGRRAMLGVSAVLAMPLVGCGSSEGDCLDALSYNGSAYVEAADVPDAPAVSIERDDLGSIVMTVSSTNCGGRLTDGEATTLSVGTPVYSIVGEAEMLAAIEGSVIVVFVVSDLPIRA